jgi:hypothetical protein
MNEHNIDNFMKLVTNGKDESDRESKADHYYRGAYEEIASGKKVCWNWAAALFGVSWLLYRKMFKVSFLYLISVILGAAVIGGLLAFLFITFLSLILPESMSIIIGFFISIASQFSILGLFGNWLYVRHIHKKIDNGYHLCPLKNTCRPLFCVSIIPPLHILALFFTPFIAWNDKRKVKAALAERALVEETVP